MVINTVDDCLLRQIAQKTFKMKIIASPVNAAVFVTTLLSNMIIA